MKTLKTLLAGLLRPRAEPPRRPRRAPRARPRLEYLEDRLSPAVLPVTSAADTHQAGLLTLREAVALANADAAGGQSDTIAFAASLGNATIALTAGQLELSGASGSATETIDGGGRIAVSGNNAGRVLQVDAGVNAAVAGLTVTRGNSASGGGIYNIGTLALSTSTFSANSASNGGGLGNAGALTVSGSTFAGNSATSGGGIANFAGTLTVSGSTFAGNVVIGGGGGISNASTLTVNDSTFEGNSANGSGGGISNADVLTVSDCTLAGNSATGGFGGGIYTNGALTVNNGIVAGNTAAAAPDLSGPVDARSGYTLIGNGSGLSGISNGVNGNRIGTPASPLDPRLAPLDSYGGAAQTFGLLPGSPALAAGGPGTTLTAAVNATATALGVSYAAGLAVTPGLTVRIDAEQLAITAVNRLTNTFTVLRGANGTAPAAHALGAGVFPAADERGLPRVVSGSPDVGAFQTQANPFQVTTAADPGGLPGLLALREAVNLANALPGGHTVTFAVALGSATVNLRAGALELRGSGGTEGIDGAGRTTLSGYTANRVVVVGAGATASLAGLTLTNGLFATDPTAVCGGLDNFGTLALSNCTLSYNVAASPGGAIYNAGSLTLGGSTLFANFSYSEGGGIDNAGALTLLGSTLSANGTFGSGGDLEDLSGGTAAVTGSTLSGGFARANGGGVGNSGTLTLTGSTVAGNYVNGDGSGVASSGTLTVSGSTVSGNAADGSGGGLLVSGGAATLSNSTVAGNSCGAQGGGLYAASGSAADTLTLTSVTVAINFATGGGGGLFVAAGAVAAPLPRNALIASNTSGGGSTRDDVRGRLSGSGSYTLIGDGTGMTGLNSGVNGNRVGTAASPLDPRLGPLADNGGPTQTQALLAGSPAIGLGDPALAGTPDQRGVIRTAPVSIGGYQNTATATSTVVSATSGTTVYGQGVTFTATVTASGGPVPGTVTFRDGGTTLSTLGLDGTGRASLPTTALGAGTHTVVATYNPTGSYTTSSGSISHAVNRAALTIAAANKTKVYGQANPTLTATYAGFVNGDTAAVVGGLTLSTTATAGSPVGTYLITPSGASAANYTIGYASGNLAVTPAPLVVTADNKSKVYGSANPLLSATISGLVNGDAPAVVSGLTWSTTATTGSPVGNYPITVSGGSAANYTLGYVAGTLTVTRAPLRIAAANKTKVYGQANPTLTATYAGFVNGDTAAVVGGLTLSTTATAGSPVGTYLITPSGASAANYTISYASGTLLVTPAALTITADDQTKVAGDPVPPLTASYTGFVNGDTPDSLTSPVVLATSGSDLAGTYAITASGAASPNYAIAFVDGILTVAPAAASTFAVSILPAAADAGAAVSVTVTATDAYGNAATGYTGTVTFSTSAGQADLPAAYAFQPADGGTQTFTATLYSSGPQTVTATDADASFAGSGGVVVTPLAATSLVAAAPPAVTAGGLFGVTVTAYDPYGNVATGYQGTVTLQSTDPAAPFLSSYTFTAADAGAYTFTALQLLTAGPQSVSAADGALGGQADLTVSPGAAASLVLTGPAGASAGVPFALTLTAYDAYGNVATGYAGTVAFASTDPDAGLPADYAFGAADAGTHDFAATLLAAGTTVTLTVSDPANNLSVSFDVLVT